MKLYTRIVKYNSLWEVSFTFNSEKDIRVKARDLNRRITYTAPTHSKIITEVLPVELWPAFALPLANMLEQPIVLPNEEIF